MTGQRVTRKPFTPDPRFSESFKRKVVREFEGGYLNKMQLARKYGISGKGTILSWCRKYGKLYYPPNSGAIGRPMKDPQKQRIKELEKALENERLKVMAYEKLLEVIKQEDGIDLLKKGVARQLPHLPRSTDGK